MTRTIQEQEHLDHLIGSASELENAYHLSLMEAGTRVDPRITRALARGRFVVVAVVARYCPRTDACLGNFQHYVASCPLKVHADRVAAHKTETDACDEVSFLVRSPQPVVLPTVNELAPF